MWCEKNIDSYSFIPKVHGAIVSTGVGTGLVLSKYTIPQSENLSAIINRPLNSLVLSQWCQEYSYHIYVINPMYANVRRRPPEARASPVMVLTQVPRTTLASTCMLIFSPTFTYLQPGADPGVCCRPVAWRNQNPIKCLGTRVTAWYRSCVFDADWPVTLQCHICPSSYGKIVIVGIGTPVINWSARQSVDTHIESNCTYFHYTWDLYVIDNYYIYNVIDNDSLIPNLKTDTIMATKLN